MCISTNTYIYIERETLNVWAQKLADCLHLNTAVFKYCEIMGKFIYKFNCQFKN